jgi:hypothetical protein
MSAFALLIACSDGPRLKHVRQLETQIEGLAFVERGELEPMIV